MYWKYRILLRQAERVMSHDLYTECEMNILSYPLGLFVYSHDYLSRYS